EPARERREDALTLTVVERGCRAEVHGELDAGVGGVHPLAARAGGAGEAPLQLVLADDDAARHVEVCGHGTSLSPRAAAPPRPAGTGPAWPSATRACFAPPVSNLTRDETRARAAQLSLHAVTVELDLRAARDRATATFPTTTTVRLTSTGPDTWLDFLGPEVHAVVVDGVEHEVRHADGRIHVGGLR